MYIHALADLIFNESAPPPSDPQISWRFTPHNYIIYETRSVPPPPPPDNSLSGSAPNNHP